MKNNSNSPILKRLNTAKRGITYIRDGKKCILNNRFNQRPVNTNQRSIIQFPGSVIENFYNIQSLEIFYTDIIKVLVER
jgi:GTP1/Obg family GTP-binding protein